jgi:CheY-like chemotaxis protein
LAQPFDVILLDMQMPIMDGYTAAAEMCKAGIRCPIIALTAHAMSGDAEKCMQAGCSHYLSKPVESERLLRTLAAMLPPSTRPSSQVAEAHRPIVAEPILSSLPLDKQVIREIVRDFVSSLTQTLESLDTT